MLVLSEFSLECFDDSAHESLLRAFLLHVLWVSLNFVSYVFAPIAYAMNNWIMTSFFICIEYSGK